MNNIEDLNLEHITMGIDPVGWLEDGNVHMGHDDYQAAQCALLQSIACSLAIITKILLEDTDRMR